MTDELQVKPEDVDKFAGSMRDLSSQAEAAQKYATGYFELDAEQARLYVFVKGVVDNIRQNLEANYEQLQRLSDSSSTELTRSAQMYRTTDSETAKRMDRTYPGAPR